MLYRSSLSLLTFRFIVISYVLILSGALFYSYWSYRNKLHHAQFQLETAERMVGRHLEQRFSETARLLEEMAEAVRRVQGKPEAVRALIEREVNRKGLPQRIAWSDEKGWLVVGTAIALFTPHVTGDYLRQYRADLSGRDYIARAREHPGELIASGRLNHAITGRNIFVLAMGVRDAQGGYLGCLADVVDLDALSDLIAATLRGSHVQAALTLPNGETVFSSFAQTLPAGGTVSPSGYRWQAAIDPLFLQSLRREWMVELLLIALGITLVFFALYHGFSHHLSRPAQEMLHILFGINPVKSAEAIPSFAMYALLPRIQHISDLADDYHRVKKRLDEREARLAHANEVLQGIRQDYFDTLDALSRELYQVFDAIRAYGDLCREASLSPAGDAYQHQAEIEEFGLNMKFISNALYLLCQANCGELQLQAGMQDVDACLRQSLAHCQEAIEDKTVAIGYVPAPLAFCQDETLLRYLIDGFIFTVWRYMAYASKAELQVETDSARDCLRLTAHIHELEDVFLPRSARDASLFIPSRRTSSAAEITRHLDRHINVKMLRMLAGLGKGSLQLSPGGKGMRLTLVIGSRQEEMVATLSGES